MMTCRDLAERIEQLQPEARPRDVARLCLLLTNAVGELDALSDEETLCEEWSRVYLQMQSITDQHEAMTDELEALAQLRPDHLSPGAAQTLFRAIKTQSQVLDLYVGSPRSEK